ncbi:phasin family protein [Alicyclobacillus fastidiosus]|uniref:Polyhydroxyalkanoate synthesis regulator phasin n=1 Tax=Alicyclobacillus fastidiosus TaxID=392011 RepID=A0ABV5ANB5_9BACL|nr:hypothetical protein [Alicyclobacillus fastidiosus]WEH10222.1 hypothetical protein PYS47_02955 [Alicyclobacillus fastidiosus]
MEDTIRKMVDLGVGFMSLSREKVAESARVWAEKRKLTPEQTRAFVQELVERGEQGRTELQNSIQEQVQKTMERLGIRAETDSIREELSSLRLTVAHLRARVEELEAKVGTEADGASADTQSD